MKNIARLVLVFTFSFVGVFVLAAAVRFLRTRIDIISVLPAQGGRLDTELLSAAHWALPLSLYCSLLFGLSYTIRRRIFAPAAMLSLFVLSSAASLGSILGTEGFHRLPPYTIPPRPLGNPGLILAQANNAIVLVQDPAEIWGARVVSIPGQALDYHAVPQGPDNKPARLPPIPFRTNTAWVLESLELDLSLTARLLTSRFSSGGILSFMVYVCALSFLLISLRFVLCVSKWPLANLFFGALVFRAVLSIETFFAAPEPQEILNGMVGDLIPPQYTTPLIFVFLGVLVCLYTVLSYLIRRKDLHEN
ncbi:MAG: hypothetical protein LBP20_11220 [Treponema sp.]|jgi:hypothetical protein|nr:hypothetical protein [Treponema sp.]